MEKCEVHPDLTRTPAQKYQARYAEPVFLPKTKKGRGGPPADPQIARWYDGDFREIVEEQTTEELLANWDGCYNIPGVVRPDVPGLGRVDQVETIRDPNVEVQELICRVNPGKRTHFAAVYFEQSMLLFGGRTGHDTVSQDLWYRDDRTPSASMLQKPASHTSGEFFEFACDEPICSFEVQLQHADENLPVTNWQPVAKNFTADMLNVWQKDRGSGSGNYILYARAVDPAGNTDYLYREGINMHRWYYQNPLPWGLILGGSAAGLFFIFALYVEYRRRKKKRAMQRYAMKRMRRKFKQQQEKGGKEKNWRDVYDEDDEVASTDMTLLHLQPHCFALLCISNYTIPLQIIQEAEQEEAQQEQEWKESKSNLPDSESSIQAFNHPI
ncbi:unnamed protein product [Chrysoparadoxa australica]